MKNFLYHSFFQHFYDEVPQHAPETPPNKQISTEILTDSLSCDLETRFALAGIVFALLIPLLLVGASIWVMIVTNWNFLQWME